MIDWSDPDDLTGLHDDARQEALAERDYRRQLDRHPHCADPDHPGCERCRDEENDHD